MTRASNELVVLLHGLNRTGRSMSRIAAALKRDGYRTISPSYPSRSLSFEDLATVWLPRVLAEHCAPEAARVHFVTHSMGGIVVRLWLRELPALTNLGRIVMIAPPNKGSEVPDRLRDNPLFQFVGGVNGHRLGTAPGCLPGQLDAFPENIDLGIIAGDSPLHPLFYPWVSRPGDGTVSVASTRLAGMRDHIVMPHSHNGLILRDNVIAQAKHFLLGGKFSK